MAFRPTVPDRVPLRAGRLRMLVVLAGLAVLCLLALPMNCGVRKSARLSHPEKARVTGPVNMQTVTVLLRISE